jgi:asparagine synthetase B (glutamine-hydrolysing)
MALARQSGIRIEQRGSVVTVETPPVCVERVFYRVAPGELLVSTDLRLLHETGDTLDDDGIHSLLVLGGCIPPLTPYSQVRSLLPGFSHRYNLRDGQLESHPATTWSPPSPEDQTLPSQDQVTLLRQVLDEAIEDLCPGDAPIVLLSGGVDSAAIAARLVASGRRRTVLFHCSFGDEDDETRSAREVASVLGLALEVVSWREASGYDVLNSAAARYSLPFVDTACMPAMVLANGVAARAQSDRIVFDGTGADACFGKWSRASQSTWLYALPEILRLGIGELYDKLNLYRRAGPTEKILRLMRRSSQLGRQAFLASQHPLAGIAFSTSSPTLDRLSRLCDEWAKGLARGTDVDELSSLLYLGHVCAGIQIQKNQVFKQPHGFDLAYPYMAPAIIDLAISHARFWPGGTRPKNVLRLLAAEALPHQIAFRPKRGFVPPLGRLMTHPTFLEHLDAATHEGAPLLPYIDSGFIARSLSDLRSRRSLPLTTYTLLWAVAFCNSWLSQIKVRARPSHVEHSPGGSMNME